jgi:hypothetical protein
LRFLCLVCAAAAVVMLYGNMGYSQSAPEAPKDGCCLMIGDVDGNNHINILDIVYLVNYLYKGGPRPACFAEADINCDCVLNIKDIPQFILYLYYGLQPWPYYCTCEQWYDNCGEDPW